MPTEGEVTHSPERLDLRSENIAADRVEELLRLFPEIRTEGGRLDFERLKLALGEHVDVGRERYGLTWPGKADCFRTIQAPSLGTLRPAPDESVNWDTTENLIIEGDNLEVLKLLQKSYLGKVKMIYIDPPYNTGNDFIYPDNFSESLKTYLEYTGQVDAEGRQFSTNTDTDGRFHSKWLNMMYPRLYLARNLLREDGVIFISIDENEIDNLKKLCSEIFGEENLEGIISWRRRHNQPNDPTKMLGKVSEFIVAYARDGAALRKSGVGKVELTGKFTNPDGDPRGPWSSKPWKVGSGQSGSTYTITTPTGGVYHEAWMGEQRTFEALRDEGRIIFPNGGSGPPRKKYFQSERAGEGQAATTWWSHDDVGHNQEASDELAALFGAKQVFDNPKPVRLIRNLVRVGDASGDGLILDFFAGSGTTAEAVIRGNQLDGTSRRFILVQLPEPLAAAGDTPGARVCDDLRVPRNIAELTKERVRRSILNLNQQTRPAPAEDRGFRTFRLAESNFNAWDAGLTGGVDALVQQLELHVENVRHDRREVDVLYELLLKSGFPLDAQVETVLIAGKKVFSVGGGVLMVCLDHELTIELIRAVAVRQPERFVVLDHGFASNDQLKTNAALILKAAAVTFRTA